MTTPEEFREKIAREKIAQRIFELYYAHLPPSKDWTKACLGLTDEILVILKKAGYVQQHPDQKVSIPKANRNYKGYSSLYNDGFKNGITWLRKQGFKRVIL